MQTKIQSNPIHKFKFSLILLMGLLTSVCMGTGLENSKNTNYTFEENTENFVALARKVQKIKNKDVYDCGSFGKIYIVHLDENSLAMQWNSNNINPKYILLKKLSEDTFRVDLKQNKVLLTFNTKKISGYKLTEITLKFKIKDFGTETFVCKGNIIPD